MVSTPQQHQQPRSHADPNFNSQQRQQQKSQPSTQQAPPRPKQDDSWKKELNLPPKDTRVKTEVLIMH